MPKLSESSSVLSQLKNFDLLPNSAHVRVDVVAGLFGCSVPTVWRRARLGKMPQPRKLAGTPVWRVGDLRAMLEAAT